MITRSQSKTIRTLWEKFRWATDNLDWTDYAGKLLRLTTEETKSHDRFRGDSIRRGMSKFDEARYFALKRLAEFAILRESAPKLEGYFHYQHSVYAAWAIVHDEPTAVAVAKWASENLEELNELLTWDYCVLIADRAEAA